MKKVTRLDKYTMVKGLKKIFEEIEEKNKEKNTKYDVSYVNRIADRILESFGFKGESMYIPIFKIAKEIGFEIYVQEMPDSLSGYIMVNGNTQEKYKNNKVIIINKNDELAHKRFVIAHEFAHYLFDFLGNPEYNDISKRYVDTYRKNKHNSPEEQLANQFAAELLMPAEIFITQYYKAKEVDERSIFVIQYLSKFFGTTEDSVIKRIGEVI